MKNDYSVLDEIGVAVNPPWEANFINYNIRAIIAYAKQIGKKTEDLTKEEVSQFIIKS